MFHNTIIKINYNPMKISLSSTTKKRHSFYVSLRNLSKYRFTVYSVYCYNYMLSILLLCTNAELLYISAAPLSNYKYYAVAFALFSRSLRAARYFLACLFCTRKIRRAITARHVPPKYIGVYPVNPAIVPIISEHKNPLRSVETLYTALVSEFLPGAPSWKNSPLMVGPDIPLAIPKGTAIAIISFALFARPMMLSAPQAWQ